jgi:hypothetical protein
LYAGAFSLSDSFLNNTPLFVLSYSIYFSYLAAK